MMFQTHNRRLKRGKTILTTVEKRELWEANDISDVNHQKSKQSCLFF